MKPQDRNPILLIACLVFSPRAQAVVPAPDGGYPGGNTAEGQSALLSLTTGTYNTAVGLFSLRSNTQGQFNTATGAGALLVNTANENTASGAGALLSNITGTDNTANGAFALFFNIATGNTAVGSRALVNNTTGGTVGAPSGVDVGPNTAVGTEALQSNAITSANTAVGYQALGSYTTGFMGTDLGANTAVGFQALGNATGGDSNNAFGYQALTNNTSGRLNTAIGYQALFGNTTGGNNTAVGNRALANNISGSGNVVVGHGAGSAITTAANVIAIGTAGTNIENSCFIGNIFGTQIANGIPVVLDSFTGQLGEVASSERFKTAIKPMDQTSEAILALKPVKFHYKSDKTATPQFGLIAEEVAAVNPALVVRDKEARPHAVRYDAVNAMLLNEFLKEHRKMQQLEATVAQQRNDFETTITELKKEMKCVAARFKEQDARIQKISTRVELSEVATSTTVSAH